MRHLSILPCTTVFVLLLLRVGCFDLYGRDKGPLVPLWVIYKHLTPDDIETIPVNRINAVFLNFNFPVWTPDRLDTHRLSATINHCRQRGITVFVHIGVEMYPSAIRHRYKQLGLEVNHGCLTPRQAAESGLAVIKTLLFEGNARAAWQMQEGYPNELLIGDFFTSIRATGGNAGETRKSRRRIWQNRSLFARPTRKFQPPGTVRVETAYSGQALDCPFALVCRIPRSPDLKRVRINGEIVEPNTMRDECSTYVSVNVCPSGKGEYELVVEF